MYGPGSESIKVPGRADAMFCASRLVPDVCAGELRALGARVGCDRGLRAGTWARDRV
jgi:hypothetical protein